MLKIILFTIRKVEFISNNLQFQLFELLALPEGVQTWAQEDYAPDTQDFLTKG